VDERLWTTAEVAAVAGVTSRTLRHYDAIGLVRPASTGAGGLRHYGAEQLLRLQEVLVLRELGLRLEVVAGVLSGERDRLEALRGHERHLREEAARTARLADTVARTLAHLEGSTTMSTEQMFEGFEGHAERVAAYEEELVAQHGEGVREAFRTSEQRTAGWGREEYEAAAREGDDLDERFVALLRSGAAPDGEAAQGLVAEHHAAVAQFWTPDRSSYTGLGRIYVDDPRFRARYDAKDPRLAEYLSAAMAVYAQRHLP
jgi:DNA-binding transcriptional MerR regulator